MSDDALALDQVRALETVHLEATEKRLGIEENTRNFWIRLLSATVYTIPVNDFGDIACADSAAPVRELSLDLLEKERERAGHYMEESLNLDWSR
jgi:hypothetical protein